MSEFSPSHSPMNLQSPTPWAFTRVICSGILGVLIGSWGNVKIMGFLDFYCTPPLIPIMNMGQHGFLFLLFGIYGGVLGMIAAAAVLLGRSSGLFLYGSICLLLFLFHSSALASFGVRSVLTVSLVICIFLIGLTSAVAVTARLAWSRE